MKKILLTMIISGLFFNIENAQVSCASSTDVTVGGLVVGGVSGMVLGGAIISACYRESNAVKVEKIERIWRHVVDNVALTRPQDFSKLIPAFKNFDIFVYELHDALQDRYSSWTTPWNWLPSMRLAYKKATLLQMLFKYLDILRYWHVAIPEDSIERLATNICGNSYSITRFVQVLDKDMHAVQVIMNDVYCPFGNILYDHLRAVKEIAMQSYAYKMENPRPANQV